MDESDDEDGEEEYEPQFDDDEDDDAVGVVSDGQQMLSHSKPSMPLKPLNEEVKEMKSVDEEDSGEEDEGATNGGGTGINLQDINDIPSPKN